MLGIKMAAEQMVLWDVVQQTAVKILKNSNEGKELIIY